MEMTLPKKIVASTTPLDFIRTGQNGNTVEPAEKATSDEKPPVL